MKSLDRVSGLVLLVFAVAVLAKSTEYPLGNLQMPGAAVFPILASSLLIVIAGAIAIRGFSKPGKDPGSSESAALSRKTFGRIAAGVGALVAFRYLLTFIGFAPACFLFILFLAKALGRFTWKSSLVFSAVTAVTCFYLFQVILKIPMPGGIFGI